MWKLGKERAEPSPASLLIRSAFPRWQQSPLGISTLVGGAGGKARFVPVGLGLEQRLQGQVFILQPCQRAGL